MGSILVSSGQSSLIAGGPVAGSADGVGAAATFTSPTFLAVINETYGTTPLCLACLVCPAGQYSMCNATASVCTPCPPGTASAGAGATACTACPSGTYSAAGGACTACPAGSISTAAGATACANCSAGTYQATATACSNCTAGTYSLAAATACLPCAALTVGNATFVAPAGTNATNCPYACRPGFNFIGSPAPTCSSCAVGQWAAAGSTACAACTNLPSNATYTGAGANATGCPFLCVAGYVRAGAACYPCPAGTRMPAAGGTCLTCLAGSYSGAAATACSVCNGGTYSLGNATSCTACPGAGPYTVFIGRGTSPSCSFFCRAGSVIVNRTSCSQCINGTFATLGATACSACGVQTWSGSGATACTACSSLQVCLLRHYALSLALSTALIKLICNPILNLQASDARLSPHGQCLHALACTIFFLWNLPLIWLSFLFLQVTVVYGPGVPDLSYPYIAKSGWNVSSVQCVP